MKIDFKVDGLPELQKAIEGLGDKEEINIYRNIMKKGARNTIVSELKSRVPYPTITPKGVGVTNDRSDVNAIFAGVLAKGWKLRFLDKGTVERFTKRKKSLGRIVGRKIIDNIISDSMPRFIAWIQENIGNEMVLVMARKLKKQKKNG